MGTSAVRQRGRRNKSSSAVFSEAGRRVWIGCLSTAYMIVQRVYGRYNVPWFSVTFDNLGGETIVILGVALCYLNCVIKLGSKV